MTLPHRGPRGLTRSVAAGLDGPTEMRVGTVAAVTSRGINVSVAEGLVKNAAHLDSYNPSVGDPVLCAVFRDSWTVLGRPVGTGTAQDLATPGSGAGVTLMAGVGLSGTGATIASSTGSAVVIPRMALAYYHPPNHWVMLLTGFNWYNNTVNDWASVNVVNSQANTPVGGADLVQAGNVFFGHFHTLGVMVPPTYGGARRDMYMTIQRISGAGVVRIDDSAQRRNYLLAIDMGEQSVIPTL